MLRRTPALVALLVGVSLFAPARADHAGPEPGPTAAYNTYGWWCCGSIRWREEFKTSTLDTQRWQVGGHGLQKGGNVRHQNGMLTLNTGTRGTVKATLIGRGYKYGRWETRLRSRRYETGAANYRVITELVPAQDPSKFCGGHNISLTRYRIGNQRMGHHLRSRPNLEFRAEHDLRMRNDAWHTFAVEITDESISWFVDAHLVAREERPEAFSHTYYTVQFKMKATKGKQMNTSRMQMDWLRSWNLKATAGAESTALVEDMPVAHTAGTFPWACDKDGNTIQ